MPIANGSLQVGVVDRGAARRAKAAASKRQLTPRLGSNSEQREALLPLIGFRSTATDQLVSLADYAGRMKPGQQSIFYITPGRSRASRRAVLSQPVVGTEPRCWLLRRQTAIQT
jgi:hypothetical protein